MDEIEKIKTQIESMLYMANSPLNIIEIGEFFNLSKEEILQIILELKKQRDNTGINIKINDNLVYLSTNAKYSEVLNKFFNIEVKKRKLSQTQMEVLAIIAYKGKVTKSEIEKIRNASPDTIISVLLEKKLIYSKERKKSMGSPKLYEVTDDFYKYLGLEKEDEIYNIMEMNKNDNEEE